MCDKPTNITADRSVSLCFHCQMQAQGVTDVPGFGRLCPDDAKLVDLAERRIIEWLRDVAKFTNGGMLDDERIAKGIDEAWVVDPIDACALADAIERGEHRG